VRCGDGERGAGRGRAAAAQRLDTRLSGLHRELFVEANPIPVKWALAQMGLHRERD